MLLLEINGSWSETVARTVAQNADKCKYYLWMIQAVIFYGRKASKSFIRIVVGGRQHPAKIIPYGGSDLTD